MAFLRLFPFSGPVLPSRLDGIAWACLVALASASQSVLAQSAALENQQLQLQQQRENALRSTAEEPADVHLPTPQAVADQPLPLGESPCFPIRTVRLSGPLSERFGWVLDAVGGSHGDDAPQGRCLGAAGVDRVVQRLQQALIGRGFVTSRVLAVPQDLGGGVLTLQLLPGTVRSVRFTADSSPRGTAFNALPGVVGRPLQLRDVEQGLENFKRIPTAEADIRIAPAEGDGAVPGQSDLLVSWQQALPLRLNLAVDDGGTRSTGKRQGTATLSYDNAFTLNDLFYLSLGHNLSRSPGHHADPAAQGTRAATLHYSVPYGYWLFSTTTSRNHYHQTVAGASQDYVYSGASDNTEIKASRIVWRSGKSKTTLGLRGFRRSSSNFIDDTEIEVQRRVTAGWEASVAQRQTVGDGVLDASLALRQGTGAFGALAAPEQAFGEGTSRMRLAIADIGASQPFALAGHKLRYAGAWHAQWNRTPLTPQDRIAIGGRYSVRGFDGETSLLAERGWFWRNDLALTTGPQQEAYLGLDTGRVGGPSAAQLVGRSLTGAVLGVRGNWKALAFDVFAGAPLSKPAGYRTAHATAGFNASCSF